jgi:hypothetical protein
MGPPRMAWGSRGLPANPRAMTPACHLPEAIADALGGGDPLAGGNGVLDAGQLLDEASARGDDEAIILDGSQCWSPVPGHRRLGP